MTAIDEVPPAPPRFQTHDEWFVCGVHAGVHSIQVWAPAERVVAHLHALTAALSTPDDPTVDVFVHDGQSSRRWAGARVDVATVSDALNRARLPLAAFGGVELSLATATDQLVLTPDLMLVIYATTPRWPFLLEARGLVERQSVPAPQWSLSAARPASAPAPALARALEQFANRLALVEVHV